MNRVVRSTIVVAGLVFTLGGAASWGGPSNNDVTDSTGSTAGGTGVLNSLTTGTDNTGFGGSVLFQTPDGSRNAGFGVVALYYAQCTGSDCDFVNNTASGAYAANGGGISNNTAIGVRTLQYGHFGKHDDTATAAATLWGAASAATTPPTATGPST